MMLKLALLLCPCADHARPTPRYNYNQILYRLDLDDPQLHAK